MSKKPYDWEAWIDQKEVSESKAKWALIYLSREPSLAFGVTDEQLTRIYEEPAKRILSNQVSALLQDPNGREILRKMRLAWNVRNARNRARHKSKKSYTFMMKTGVEYKLRRLADRLATRTLAEALEWLITNAADIEVELRKMAREEIKAEKERLNRRPRKNLTPQIRDADLRDNIALLEERIKILEQKGESDS